MPNIELSDAAVNTRAIAVTDLIFAADPDESDSDNVFSADTLAQLIVTIFGNLPSGHNAFTDALLAKLNGIAAGAQPDLTGPEIVTLLSALSGAARLPATAIRDLPAGGGASISVSDEGTALTAALASMDFRGAGVTVTEGSEGVLTVTIPGGGGGTSVGTHSRLIGWSANPVPTEPEIGAASVLTVDVLVIPMRTAGQDGHIFFGVPSNPGLPNQLHFSNNPAINQFGAFDTRSEANAGDFTRGGIEFEIMSTKNVLYASFYGTGSVSLILAYT
ncbi:MAG: hypothetical protein OXO51_16055 [Gemmatimonadota bacterium]|nr:hypothetical protein [Gemmatimonadota bacterium]